MVNISKESLNSFIEAATFRKKTLLRCLDVLLYKEENVIDDVTIITTFHSPNDQGISEEDELMIHDEFPGREERVLSLKYSEFFLLVKNGFASNSHFFNDSDQNEIQEIMDTL